MIDTLSGPAGTALDWTPRKLGRTRLKSYRQRAASLPARWHPLEVREILAHHDAVIAEKDAQIARMNSRITELKATVDRLVPDPCMQYAPYARVTR